MAEVCRLAVAKNIAQSSGAKIYSTARWCDAKRTRACIDADVSLLAEFFLFPVFLSAFCLGMLPCFSKWVDQLSERG